MTPSICPRCGREFPYGDPRAVVPGRQCFECDEQTARRPLFVCAANCCRSVLAEYLYRDLCHAPAASAGLDAGTAIFDTCAAMLRDWHIDASGHQPRQLTRQMCDEASAIFVMTPALLHQLVRDYGEDLADKSYLFADPFTVPCSRIDLDSYTVVDPFVLSDRPISQLTAEYAWMRSQVRLIQRFPGALVPLRAYLDLVKTVDWESH